MKIRPLRRLEASLVFCLLLSACSSTSSDSQQLKKEVKEQATAAKSTSSEPETEDGSKKLSWIQKSNLVAEAYTKELSEEIPELGSSLGYQEFDGLGMTNTQDMEDRVVEIQTVWEIKLEQMLAFERHPELRLDYQILLESVKDSLNSTKKTKELKSIDTSFVGKAIFIHLQQLVNPQSSKQRKSNAVKRMKFYAGQRDSGYKPTNKDQKPVSFAKAEIQKLEALFKSTKPRHFFSSKG